MSFAPKKTNISTVLNRLDGKNYFADLESISNAMFGKDDIITDPSIKWWLSSGVWPLDLMVSRGNGLPAGKVIEVFGPPKTGKTTLCLEICKQAQLAGGLAQWIDFEAAMSNKLSKEMVGIDPSPQKWRYIQPMQSEKTYNYLEALIRYHSEYSTAPLVIVIDSIPAAVAIGEREKGMADNVKVGELALTLSRWLPRILVPLAKGNVIFLMINQLRTKFNATKGKATTEGPTSSPTGGMAPEYYSHLRLDLRAQEIIEDDDDKQQVGSLVRCTIDKSRIDTPYRSCLYPIYFRDDQMKQAIDNGMACLIYALSRKLIPGTSNGWYEYEGKNHRKETLHAMFYSNGIFRTWLQELVRKGFELEYKIKPKDAPPKQLLTEGGLPYDPKTGEVLGETPPPTLDELALNLRNALSELDTTNSELGGASMLVPSAPEPPPSHSDEPTNPQTNPEMPKVKKTAAKPAAGSKGGRPKGSTSKPNAPATKAKK